jgi:acyl-CoA hydrolase
VVTEQGVAECFGRTAEDQAKNLIEQASHPDAREYLRETARATGLIY